MTDPDPTIVLLPLTLVMLLPEPLPINIFSPVEGAADGILPKYNDPPLAVLNDALTKLSISPPSVIAEVPLPTIKPVNVPAPVPPFKTGKASVTSVVKSISLTVVKALVPFAFKNPAVNVAAPLPPSLTANVPDILLALKSKLIVAVSITRPLLAFKSAAQ